MERRERRRLHRAHQDAVVRQPPDQLEPGGVGRSPHLGARGQQSRRCDARMGEVAGDAPAVPAASWRPNSPTAILDWLYARMPSYERSQFGSSQLIVWRLAATL